VPDVREGEVLVRAGGWQSMRRCPPRVYAISTDSPKRELHRRRALASEKRQTAVATPKGSKNGHMITLGDAALP
jgi:hypothetical protein